MKRPLPTTLPETKMGVSRFSRRTWLLAAVAAAVVAVGGFAGVYFTLFNGSSAAPLKLSSAPVASRHVSAAAVAGTWSIAAGSVAGYRVREKLAFLPAKSDAVGRTSDVAGSLTVAQSGGGLTVRTASFMANVRTLKSDRSMRDARIHRIGLQSNQYPTAGFKLTRTISLPAEVLKGQAVHTTATGLLTIQGTTRSVTIPITTRISGGQIEAVGSITFPFSEFGMQAPSIGGFVSVESHATMEFDLRFRHGASAANAASLRAIAALKPASSSSTGFGPGPGAGPGPAGANSQALSSCLRRHGVTPTAGGRPGTSQNPKVAAALKACGASPPPAGQGSPPGPNQNP